MQKAFINAVWEKEWMNLSGEILYNDIATQCPNCNSSLDYFCQCMWGIWHMEGMSHAVQGQTCLAFCTTDWRLFVPGEIQAGQSLSGPLKLPMIPPFPLSPPIVVYQQAGFGGLESVPICPWSFLAGLYDMHYITMCRTCSCTAHLYCSVLKMKWDFCLRGKKVHSWCL